jgi:hypothetical protein
MHKIHFNIVINLFFGVLIAQAQINPNSKTLSSLEQEVETISQFIQSKPVEKGPKWRKWTSTNTPWNTLIATTSMPDTTFADWVMCLSDTLPLFAMTAAPKNKHYDCLKLDKSLCQGWDFMAKSSNPKGIIDWVALENLSGKVFLSGDKETGTLQSIVTIFDKDHFLLINTDTTGETFESMLIFNVKKKTIDLCCNFALNAEKIRYLFIKSENDNWLEITYAKGSKKPVGIAKHHKIPGQLSSALLDLNRDGRLDALAQISDSKGKNIQFKTADVALSATAMNDLDSLKNTITDSARKAHQIWLDSQWLWSKLKPMGLQLPMRYRMDTKK